MYQMTRSRPWLTPHASGSGDPRAAGCNGPGLLEGTAGVALAMEAACTTAEPVWTDAAGLDRGNPQTARAEAR